MKKCKIFIGILSGTSMDSIDCGIYNFCNNKLEEIAFYENKYPDKIRNKMNNNLEELKKNYYKSYLNVELSNEYGKIVNEILAKEQISPKEVMAIGMHGQTISHLEHEGRNISIQIGCPKTLSKETKIKVISDFRNHDIENGGEGAPLAPIFHNYIFKKNDKKRIIVNIGGISNISLIENDKNIDISGFDTGPGNTLIDSWMKNNFNTDYDKNGHTANKYETNENLLNIFLEDKYFKKKLPKSTTTEYFCYKWVLDKLEINNNSIDKGVVLSTLTMLSAVSILKSIKENYKSCDEIFVCGGGAFNETLIFNLKESAEKYFSKEVSINTTKKLGFNPKSVEAGLFAWLAMSRINNIKLDYTNITGAKKPCVLGSIYNPM